MSASREPPPDAPPLVELAPVPEFWVDGIGKVESLGGGAYRILLYKIKRPPEGDAPVEREIVAAVLTNLAHVNQAIALLRALAEGAMARVGMLLQ